MILFSCFLIQHTNVITETFFVLQKMYLHLKQEASNTFWKCEMVEDYHCAASHLHFLKMRSHATARCGLGHSLTETINTLPVKHLGMTAYVAPKPVCKAGFSIVLCLYYMKAWLLCPPPTPRVILMLTCHLEQLRHCLWRNVCFNSVWIRLEFKF